MPPRLTKDVRLRINSTLTNIAIIILLLNSIHAFFHNASQCELKELFHVALVSFGHQVPCKLVNNLVLALLLMINGCNKC